MRRWLQIAVSMACLIVILLGARLVWAKEHIRQTDLHAFYQQINRASFDGKLPDAQVGWLQMDNAAGLTKAYRNPVQIWIDPRDATTDTELLDTVRHEMCHVSVHEAVELAGEDQHGNLFQACLAKFNAQR
jgi:predicted SprT family Zn-dependent metalloprotease